MIRQLVQCPYCQACEVALTDSLDVLFNPEADPSQPCPHLIWIEGRYSQWALNALAGRKTKIAHMVGSNEFEWQRPDLSAHEDAEQLWHYLKDLTNAGSGWEFAPALEHSVRPISLDQKVTDANGREYPSWEIEGTAVFAIEAEAFLASLPACLERQNAAWTDLPGSAAE